MKKTIKVNNNVRY